MRVASEVIYTVRTIVDPKRVEEFNEWQDTEHVPWIFSVAGYYSNQRFHHTENEFKYMNIWEIESIASHDSPEKMSMSGSPWGKRMKRFRKLSVTFYQQRYIWDRKTETDNQFQAMAYLAWDGEGTEKELQWVKEHWSPAFADQESVLGFRYFEKIRGERENLLLLYLKEDTQENRKKYESCLEELQKRTNVIESEWYLPMASAIYK